LRNDCFADARRIRFEVVSVVVEETYLAAAIDKQCRTVRKCHKCRIALSNIEKIDMQSAVQSW